MGLLLLLLGRLQNLERAEQALIDAHHSACVVEFAAVVRCREERNELPLGEELVPIFDDLVRTADQIHVVLLQKAGHDIRPECERDTAIVFAPPSDVLVWVRPQQVAQQTAVRNLPNVSLTNTSRAMSSKSNVRLSVS